MDQSQFLKDLSMVQKLAVHQNVISFYGICQTADWLYLLFEDTPTTLKRTLIESRTPPNVNPHRFSSLSEQRVLVILHEIAVAMEYLTSEQVGPPLTLPPLEFASILSIRIFDFAVRPQDPVLVQHPIDRRRNRENLMVRSQAIRRQRQIG